MAQITVQVHGGHFDQSSGEAHIDDTLVFTNHRKHQVTINLSPSGFFSVDQQNVAANSTGTAITINGPGTGTFEAKKTAKSLAGPGQEEGDMKGNIKVNPND